MKLGDIEKLRGKILRIFEKNIRFQEDLKGRSNLKKTRRRFEKEIRFEEMMKKKWEKISLGVVGQFYKLV